MSNWEWDKDFMYKLLVTEEIVWDGAEFDVVLLDSNGMEVKHPDYPPGGFPTKGLLEMPLHDKGDVRLHLVPDKFKLKAKARAFDAYSAAIVYHDTGYRAFGMDFGWYKVDVGSSFILSVAVGGVVSVTKHIWTLVKRAKNYQDTGDEE